MTSSPSSAALRERVAAVPLALAEVTAAEPTPAERHKRNKVLRRIGLLFAVQAVIMAWALWAIWQHRGDEWAPLGPYPEQVAEPEVTAKLDAPAFVHVQATKCAHETTLVTGTMAWVSSDPAGRIIAIPTEGAVDRRMKGCTDFSYRDAIPPEVVSATASFGGVATWRLTGVETPINADGSGVPVAWQTNEVRIIVPPAPL